MAGYIDGKVEVWYSSNPPTNTNLLWMKREPLDSIDSSSIYEYNNKMSQWILFAKLDTAVIDSLDSYSTTIGLSANQGRILDGKVTDVNTRVDGVSLLLDSYELLSNKITSWGTPTDDQYPSAKLVKDTLDAFDGSKWEDSTLTQIVPKNSKHIPASIIDDLPEGGLIDVIKVNTVTQPIVNKTVDISVPTQPGDIGAATAAQGAKADTALQSETDPIFTASAAHGISSGDISNWNGKQNAIGYTTENISNKVSAFAATPNNTNYPSEKLVKDSLDLKLDKPTQTKTTPIDTDSIILKDSADSNKYKDVLKSNIDEVYIGNSAPTNGNYKVWGDTSVVQSYTFDTSIAATVSPNMILSTYKIESNYSAGNTVSISGYTNLPTIDCEKSVVIKNTNANNRIFVPASSQVVGGITYTFKMMNSTTITVPAGKLLELSYKFLSTAESMGQPTAFTVLILFVIEP